ncbi:MutS-related protein [Wukongibacter sp. M2B1]|uniref:MutS-related protein n=1 Tax=Wukongibacter sp. M2B1 TaxID=3088895 RepID=UPI003D7A28AB
MQTTIMVIGIFIFIFFYLVIFEPKTRIKKLRLKLKDQFGTKPKIVKYDFENISYYWNEYKESIEDNEKIDDITWNDLEMNHVFARINQCNSFLGEQILYSKLHYLPKDNFYRELLERKISFFKSNDNEREEVQLLFSNLGKNSKDYYIPKFMNQLDNYRVSGIWKYKTMQILLVLSIFPAIILQEPSLFLLTVSIYLINLIIYIIGKMKYEIHLNMLKGIVGVISTGNRIANTKKFSYEKIFLDIMKVAAPFKRISNIISFIQNRKDLALSGDILGIIYDYLIGATLLDFVQYDKFICLLTKRQTDFMELYRILGDIEVAITIVSFRESLTLYCLPKFSEEHVFHMKELYHSLIEEPVTNTINLDNSCIITGSNASGKSTFIKAIAINVILAQNINTCMARQMFIPNAMVVTSMAVRDDLMSGESYYIKEIKYLKRIIDSLNEDRLVICIIDEILRGTNTEERIAASASILRFLHRKNCVAIVASHDIELTRILDQVYDNYHFTEQMEENDIIFDYKLYKGASYSQNAIKLLKFVGFPNEIIEEAKKDIN